ncbi:bifunctional diguanylate cyclase/phosphodiesterase [Rhizobium glycinendophyticum]|uniref:EAL domain-containing protein n=1 Tax=Rhizobium glycinendophyticum TaxID=2589807 RepID=A0A504TU35_9HYPH|nr:EAL domain-containing protein [Rhizobium glycinendophyticum]TPP05894.1 EAL domain-containing protein [Rhizobium glycinendophyticum]
MSVHLSIASSNRPSRWATYKITLILLTLSGLAVLGLVFLAAFWAATESDAVAQERQRRLVNDRLQAQMDQAAHEIELMSVGFSSFLNSGPGQKAPLDLARATWSAATFGRIATSVFRYDAAFVVNANGELVVPRDADNDKRYRWLKPLLMPLLRRETALPDSLSLFVRNGKPSAKIGLMKLEGRPSIAGAIPISMVEHKDIAQRPGESGLYLVAFRFLDGAALQELSKEQGLAGARYSRASDQDPNEIAFQINATATDDPIGFIIWAPELPGSRVVGRLIPVLSGCGLIIAALFLALMFRLRSSLRRLSESEETARHLSLHDALTDLPNRAFFNARLEDCRQQVTSSDKGQALALLDLDHFKEVNDTFGHAVGDQLLQAAVTRMKIAIGSSHFLARIGGDEFALLIERGTSIEDAISLCVHIVELIGAPYNLGNSSIAVRIGCSAGLAILDGQTVNISEWLRRADVALYVAKGAGKNRAVLYDGAFDEGAIERERLKADLNRIFQEHEIVHDLHGTPGLGHELEELEVFFQSIHGGDRTEDLAGAEALVRWRHPQRGLLSPDVFIPLLEELGLMDRLGRFVLSRALRAAMTWPDTMTISVNVSPSQLKNPHFAQDVLSILETHRLNPARLELELTEAALFKADRAMKKSLKRLRSVGVRIALDDFGTGYSSLSHLVQFNIDRIKIDKSFVKLLGTKAEGAAIVSAVLSLSRSLGTSTTAEGVETFGQRDFLRVAGCTHLQGYLYSKPMTEHDFRAFIRSSNGSERLRKV